MITQEFRPKTFKDVAGQKLIVETLKCIAKNPNNSPRTIILQGEYGTGKTTCARILARALNCPNQVNGEPCGNCSVCNSDLEVSPFYMEYDSAVIGNVDTIRNLRDTFYYNSDDGYRIIVLDEAHLVSKAAQAALLKVFEETKGRIFFVLCTTDAQQLLPTIRSRSLELRFNLIPDLFLKENLTKICDAKNIVIDDEALDLIVSRSEGHARNAQMLLDRYFLLGDTFKESVKTSKDDFAKLIFNCMWAGEIKRDASKYSPDKVNQALEKSKQTVTEIIYRLQCNALTNLKTDYEDTVLTIIKVTLGVKTSDNADINKVAQLIGVNKGKFTEMYSTLTSDSILSSFKSDKMFQAAMWVLYISL